MCVVIILYETRSNHHHSRSNSIRCDSYHPLFTFLFVFTFWEASFGTKEHSNNVSCFISVGLLIKLKAAERNTPAFPSLVSKRAYSHFRIHKLHESILPQVLTNCKEASLQITSKVSEILITKMGDEQAQAAQAFITTHTGRQPGKTVCAWWLRGGIMAFDSLDTPMVYFRAF